MSASFPNLYDATFYWCVRYAYGKVVTTVPRCSFGSGTRRYPRGGVLGREKQRTQLWVMLRWSFSKRPRGNSVLCSDGDERRFQLRKYLAVATCEAGDEMLENADRRARRFMAHFFSGVTRADAPYGRNSAADFGPAALNPSAGPKPRTTPPDCTARLKRAQEQNEVLLIAVRQVFEIVDDLVGLAAMTLVLADRFRKV